MKHLKITSVLLSASMCISMVMTPVGVLADETAAPTETQTEVTEKEEPKDTEEKKPAETEAPKATENETEPSKETETEPSETTETEPSESTKETEETEPTEETVPEESKETETEPSESTEPSVTEEPSEPSEAKPEPETASRKSSDAQAGGGFCGENAKWAYDGYGTLTITGSGAMGNYEPNGPWLTYIDDITKVVIEDGITYIGTNNFKDCENLKSVTIPDSVTTIGSYAFAGCKSLTSVTLPSGLKEIYSYAFKDCTGIKSITIPGSVENGLYGFAFDNCGITNLTLSNGVKIISGAFTNCNNLNTVYIPKSVKSMDEAFYGSMNIKEIYYAGDATEWSNINGLSTNYFMNATVNYISTYYSLTVKDAPNGYITLSKYTASEGEQIKVIAYPDPGYYMSQFKYNNTITGGISFTMPKENVIVEPVFEKIVQANVGDALYFNGLVYTVTNNAMNGTGTVRCDGFVPMFPSDESLLYQLYGSVTIPTVVTLEGINYKPTSIKAGSFRDIKYIKTISIGSNVAVIGDNAFFNCSGLTKVTIGKGVKTIGKNAFARCPKLSSFTVTSKVLKKIGNYAFAKDSKLKTINIKYTTKLTKKGVKKSLKGSKVKTVKVKKSKVKKYRKYFTKKNAGRKVKVKK